MWLIRIVNAAYAPLLNVCLRRPRSVIALAVAITVPILFLGARVGSDFMPQLDEGRLLLQTILPPEASLEEVDRLNHRVEDLLRDFPEVDDVVRRTRAGAFPAECRNDGLRFPVAAGRVVVQPGAAGTAAVPAQQVGRHAALVEKYVVPCIVYWLRGAPDGRQRRGGRQRGPQLGECRIGLRGHQRAEAIFLPRQHPP